jgi:hypothetical protein
VQKQWIDQTNKTTKNYKYLHLRPDCRPVGLWKKSYIKYVINFIYFSNLRVGAVLALCLSSASFRADGWGIYRKTFMDFLTSLRWLTNSDRVFYVGSKKVSARHVSAMTCGRMVIKEF